MEENLHSINSMRSLEVVEVNNGKMLGNIVDIKLDCENDKVISLILPGESRGWFNGRDDEIEVPWENVVKIGVDVILVSIENLNIITGESNIYR